MFSKLLIGISVSILSASCAAQVVPAANRPPLSGSIGGGMDYLSGDWGRADINRWGPSAWATVTIWHDVSVIVEGHSAFIGGNDFAQGKTGLPPFKYVNGGGGLIWTSGYYGRFQPLLKAEMGIGSLTHPPNGSGHAHQTSTTYTLGGGFEYHTYKRLWTRVEYNYDFFTNFYSVQSGQFHSLNPRGISFGETYRFGRGGSRY